MVRVFRGRKQAEDGSSTNTWELEVGLWKGMLSQNGVNTEIGSRAAQAKANTPPAWGCREKK